MALRETLQHLMSDGLSTSSTISTTAVEASIDKLLMSRHRDTTKNNYRSVWKTFNQFLVKLYRKPQNWENHLVLFTGYLIECKRKASMVKSYISTIRSMLSEVGYILNENKYLIASLTKAC